MASYDVANTIYQSLPAPKVLTSQRHRSCLLRQTASCHGPTGRPASCHAPIGRPASCHAPTGRPASCHAPIGRPASCHAPLRQTAPRRRARP